MKERQYMGEIKTFSNKIARVYEKGKIDYIQEELVQPKNNEVLIEIKASLICGSDLHIFRDLHPAVRLPVTIGHEFTGTIIQVGSNVTKFKVGDRVTVEPSITCGVCDACRRGEYGYCEHITFSYREGHGALAKYFMAREDKVYCLPNSVSYEKGALAEPLAVAVHAVKRAEVSLGDRIVIAGAGAVGIMIAAVCKRLGAKSVVISDYSAARLALAKRLGADITVDAGSDDLIGNIKKLSGGRGFDKAFECVGKESTFRQLLECVKMNGLVTDVGIFEQPLIHIDASLLVKRELRLQGSQGYCWDFGDALQLLEELPLEALITHHFSLEDVQTAFETAGNPEGNAVKVCILTQERDGKEKLK